MKSNRALIRLLACYTVLCFAIAEANAELKRAPYLQLATPSSVYVVWRTEGPSAPILRYGPSPANLDLEVARDEIILRVSADTAESEDFPLLYKEPIENLREREERAREREGEDDAIKPDPSTLPNTYQYEAFISGLAPNRKYYYAVFDGTQRLAGGDETHFFRTSPEIGAPTSLRIYVAGDTGTGDRYQRGVYEAMRGFVNTSARPLDLYVHLGDLAYDDATDYELTTTFFDVYEQSLRNIVCWPTMGNHEVHSLPTNSGNRTYFDAFVLPENAEAGGVPSGTEAYYSFHVGSVHFICLDSNERDLSESGAMVKWLRADVERSQADWMIAFWHDAPYSKGPHDSDTESGMVRMRERIMPILEDGGVDLVLTGHSHIYERSMLMDGAYGSPTVAEGFILNDGDGDPEGDGPYRKSAGLNPHEGTVQIVAGHGAVALGRSGTMPVMRETIVEYGSVLLDIDDDTLFGRMIDINGRQRDQFSIVKRGKVAVSRIESPWQSPASPSDITHYIFNFRNEALGQPPERFQMVSDNARVARSANGKVVVATTIDDPAIGVFEDFESRDFEMRAEIRISSENPSSAGLLYRYRDPLNYYYVRLSPKTNTLGLYHVDNGETSLLAEKDSVIPLDEYIELMVRAGDGQHRTWFRGGDTVEASDPALSEPGKIGFRVDPAGTVEIRSFEIERE